jgi:hypothetical protein
MRELCGKRMAVRKFGQECDVPGRARRKAVVVGSGGEIPQQVGVARYVANVLGAAAGVALKDCFSAEDLGGEGGLGRGLGRPLPFPGNCGCVVGAHPRIKAFALASKLMFDHAFCSEIGCQF